MQYSLIRPILCGRSMFGIFLRCCKVICYYLIIYYYNLTGIFITFSTYHFLLKITTHHHVNLLLILILSLLVVTLPHYQNILFTHSRCGACMAVGIACAGTAGKEALDLLTNMLEDQTDFVRQGALISLALVLQQV